MKKKYVLKVGVAGLLLCGNCWGATKVSEESLGTAGRESKYYVSAQGVRVVVVSQKEKGYTVTADGVEGPLFVNISAPTEVDIDSRARKAIHDGSRPPEPQAVSFSKDGKRYAYVGLREKGGSPGVRMTARSLSGW